MKRRVTLLVLCLCLFWVLPIRSNAVFYDQRGTLQHVTDQADILTDQEHIELETMAQELSDSFGCDVLIAVVEDMDGYAAGDYSAMLNSGHWWDSDDAVLFLLAMEEREWYIGTFGEAIYIFTDYGLDTLGEAAVISFADGDYYGGFVTYLDMLPTYFEAWQENDPIDSYDYNPGPRDEVVYYAPVQGKTIWNVLPISLLIGLAAAAVSLFAMRSTMNTKRRQHSAGDYLKPGSYHLRTHQDIFLYSNLAKTRRQQNTGGPGGHGGHRGGGSSIHRSSGSRSHGGRGGRF